MASYIHTPALAAECGLNHGEIYAAICALPLGMLGGQVPLKIEDATKDPPQWIVLRPESALEFLLDHVPQTPAVKTCQARWLAEVDAVRAAAGQPSFLDGYLHEG